MSSEPREAEALRPGDTRLATDPAQMPAAAHLVFIGEVRSQLAPEQATPHNPTEARARGAGAAIEIAAPYRQGLDGLSHYSHVIVLVWLDRSRRDIIRHQPRHLDHPRGVFAMRSPLRPNPIGFSVARIIAVDVAAGRVTLDALDFKDGTPVIDLKPYRPGIDAIPDALIG
ncbi:MAG: tRNA (N6-threonylcarbamoyladenosine(37)-N6)-methyltransferase TrmO [Hyphomicrobiaceae bacterium]